MDCSNNIPEGSECGNYNRKYRNPAIYNKYIAQHDLDYLESLISFEKTEFKAFIFIEEDIEINPDKFSNIDIAGILALIITSELYKVPIFTMHDKDYDNMKYSATHKTN